MFSHIQQTIQKNTQKGFTLIELLVVIAIIGLLSSVVLASLQGARSKARDTKRVQEMRSIEKALSLYSIDNGGYLPKSGYTSMTGTGDGVVPKKENGSIDCEANKQNTDELFDILVPKYLSTKPDEDPYASLGYCYVYVSGQDVVYTAGAEYDASGTLVSPVVLATVHGSTKSKNAVFFSLSENTKTNSNNNALVGVSLGVNPPVALNVNLTTGIRNNTSYNQPVLNCGSNQYETGGVCVCSSGYVMENSACVLDTSCPSGQIWNGSSCVTDTSCPSGQTWNGSSCVQNTPTCSSGQTLDVATNTCVSVCSGGQVWNGSSCVQDTTCPSGQEWDNSLNGCRTSCTGDQTWNGSYCQDNYGYMYP